MAKSGFSLLFIWCMYLKKLPPPSETTLNKALSILFCYESLVVVVEIVIQP